MTVAPERSTPFATIEEAFDDIRQGKLVVVVDAVGTVRSVEAEGEGRRIWVDAPNEVLRYCVEKGSVAVDGVSLTIAELDEAGFAVALIPHTLAATTLGTLEPGARVNLEADVLAKYVERLVEVR